ncbi:MAG TPA: hypothetical protein VFU63_11235 [Ktedonobacterales bacterium]|nr:hypothetical protein [Ktedonobacterales bacterium]
MTTDGTAVARARENIGLVPLILAGLQTILLYLTSLSPVLKSAYGCSFLCGSGAIRLVPLIAALFAIAMFALPGVIGAFSRSWRGALTLAVLPWWIAVIAHAGTLLAPRIGLASTGLGGNFGVPFWLNTNYLLLLLASLALFAVLGVLGWLARRAFEGA